MKKLFAIATLITGTLFVVSCSDDDGATVAGSLSITGIPTNAQLTVGEGLVIPSSANITIAAEDGIASFSYAVDAGASVDLLAGATGFTEGSTSYTYTTDVALPTETLAIGTYEVVFTLTDADGDSDTFTHILTIADFGVVIVNDNITTNTTWTKNNVYVLASRVTVIGAELTIEPGTIIKGGTGQGTASKTLLIARGSKLIANGTAEEPIIFTSTRDNIEPGQITSPNLTTADRGLWGGVILLGDAPISFSVEISEGNDEDRSEAQVEGIPSTDTNGLYGGSNGTNNAGSLSYVSIRHAGTDIGDGDEIQGLTVGGVGSETVLKNIEIVASDDDGIEFFGGTVDADSIVIWSSTDDALDTDMDYQGTVSNFIIVSPAGGSAFELDGPEGVNDVKVNGANGFHSFVNGTVYAGDNVDHLVDWDSDTNAELVDIYFYGLPSGYMVTADDPATEDDEEFDPIETLNGDGSGTSANWQVTLNGQTKLEVMGAADGITTTVDANANTVGPNSTGFEWTFAAASGALSTIGL